MNIADTQYVKRIVFSANPGWTRVRDNAKDFDSLSYRCESHAYHGRVRLPNKYAVSVIWWLFQDNSAYDWDTVAMSSPDYVQTTKRVNCFEVGLCSDLTGRLIFSEPPGWNSELYFDATEPSLHLHQVEEYIKAISKLPMRTLETEEQDKEVCLKHNCYTDRVYWDLYDESDQRERTEALGLTRYTKHCPKCHPYYFDDKYEVQSIDI